MSWPLRLYVTQLVLHMFCSKPLVAMHFGQAAVGQHFDLHARLDAASCLYNIQQTC